MHLIYINEKCYWSQKKSIHDPIYFVSNIQETKKNILHVFIFTILQDQKLTVKHEGK